MLDRQDRKARREWKRALRNAGYAAPPTTVPPLPDGDTMLKKQSLLVDMKKIKKN